MHLRSTRTKIVVCQCPKNWWGGGGFNPAVRFNMCNCRETVWVGDHSAEKP
jgi:hypothetical protein